MDHQIPKDAFGPLSTILACFEAINQMVTLDIGPSVLSLSSRDHDGTTGMRYDFPLETTGTDSAGHRSTTTVQCEEVLKALQCSGGRLWIRLRATNGSWQVCTTREPEGRCWWKASEPRIVPGIQAIHSAYRVRMAAEDFLLYSQQIILCENYVRVSSFGQNDISLHADGELISLQIQNQVRSTIPPDVRPQTVHCTFKYIRAIVSILQKIEQVEICIADAEEVFFCLVVGAGTLFIHLKDTESFYK